MQLLDEFLAYEQRISVDTKLRTNQFVKYKSWYVSENYMKKILVYPMLSVEDKIHPLRMRTVLRMAINFVMRRTAKELFPSTSDVIQISHPVYLRAFYNTGHGHPYTLKVVCDTKHCKYSEELKREVALREQLTSLKTINIPKVLSAEQRGDAFFLLKEMILGRRFNARTDRTLYRESLLPQLRDTYQAYGVRYAPIQTFLPPDMTAKVTRLLGERADGKSFVKALKNVIERNGLVAVSLCHGDLGAGNLAVVNDTVFFLDWRKAHEGMIIADLLKTTVKYPHHYYRVKDIREIMTSNFIDNSCLFEELVTAGIALETLRVNPIRIPKLLHIWHHHAL